MLLRFAAFGGSVMLTPAIRYLAAQSCAPIHYAGRGPWSECFFSCDPDVASVAQIFSKRAPRWANGGQRALVRWLRERNGARVLDLEGDAKSAELLTAAGVARERVWRVPPVARHYRHTARRNLARAKVFWEGEGAGDDVREANVSLHVPPAWKEDAEAWLSGRGWAADPLVLVSAGNKRTMARFARIERASNFRHWPRTDWAALIDRILGLMPSARVLIIGAPTEYRLGTMVADLARSDRVHPVANDLNIPRILALMARAHSVITLDSGPSHAAAAVGAPLITLFHATDPKRAGPLSAAPLRMVLPPGVGVDDWRPGRIEVEQVVAAWSGLVAELNATPAMA